MKKEKILRRSTLYLNKLEECQKLNKEIAELRAENARFEEALETIAYGSDYESSTRAVDALEGNKAKCLHTDIYYNAEADNYYCQKCKYGMGQAYYLIAKKLSRLTAALKDDERAEKVATRLHISDVFNAESPCDFCQDSVRVHRGEAITDYRTEILKEVEG